MYLNAIERTGGDFSGEDSYLQDIPAIKAATEELTQAFYAVSEKLYQQANPQGAQGGAQGPQGGADAGAQGGQQYYDADYKVVDDDDQNKK